MNVEEGRGIWRRHAGKITGAAAGVVIALLVKWLGVGWTLLVVALAWLGVQIGARVDEGELDWADTLERWWSRPGKRHG
ncbi:MAG TPA: DUF2273 domain-containing protein [Thermaerobacter sp.]